MFCSFKLNLVYITNHTYINNKTYNSNSFKADFHTVLRALESWFAFFFVFLFFFFI